MTAFSLLGNDAAQSLLKNTLQTDRLSHAYLFFGEEGLGKKTLARAFAQAILCENGHAGCGECRSCQKVLQGVHPDFVEIGPSEGKQSIPVDAIRSLTQAAYIRPNESDYRVFLLKDVQCMLPAAANAFLKLLEEPPEQVVFLLTCLSRTGILQTLSSRCICVQLYPVSGQEVKEALSQQSGEVDPQTLETACSLSGGNIGRALYYAKDPQGGQAVAISEAMFSALFPVNELRLVQATAPLEKAPALIQPVLVCLLERFTHALCQPQTAPEGARYTLLKMIDCVGYALTLLSQNVNNKLLITHLCAGLASCGMHAAKG